MFNLSDETDYKILSETKNYYNFFILAVLILFTSIFIRLIFLSFENNNNLKSNNKDINFKVLPTIYDFNKNIYGKRIKVEFKNKIREEQKFDNIDALKDQIHKDINVAKKLLNN